MSDLLIRLFGLRGAALHAAPASYPHYVWLRRQLKPGPLRTLDAGCGAGTFTLLAASMGNEALGVTDSADDCAKARRRAGITKLPAQFRILDLREADRHDCGQFDQILLLECIEHIINDRKLIHDLSAMLKPGGRLIVTTPYYTTSLTLKKKKCRRQGLSAAAVTFVSDTRTRR